MWKPLKIKSSVLQLSILVAVMVGVLLLSFITLNHTHSIFRLQSETLLKQLDQNESFFFAPTTPTERDTDILQLISNFRGGFQMLTSISKEPHDGLKKIGLIGASSEKEEQTLYLKDNQNPLVLVGNAVIQGDVKIPSSGIKSGVIAGTYFQGKDLVRGHIRYSNSNLPTLEKEFASYIRDLQNKRLEIDYEETSINPSIKNSFRENEKVNFNQGRITLYEEVIGNVRLQSDTEIYVSKGASLKDVLLIAPIIKIEKGFKGSVHLVARDSIIIEENVTLEFPSSLVVMPRLNSESPSAIVIKDRSNVYGSIIYLNKPQEKRNSNVLISENATVTGAVYCEGYLEHYGTIYGNVYTSFFITKAKGSVYINHMMDGKIISPKGGGKLSHLPLATSYKTAVQWLY